MAAPATAEQIRDVNTRYHDTAARTYDAKWSVDFGARGQAQVLGKLVKALGAARPPRFGDALEIGAGTGYFGLNLLRSGAVRHATCTDISPGMLSVLRDNARRLGLEVDTLAAEAEALPFPAASFDLVVGHAVLHHLPDLGGAFAEFHRVLRPGGFMVFAGEPSRVGDRLAAAPKRAAHAAAPLWRAALRARAARRPGPGDAQARLERIVDVHAFAPRDLALHARRTGFGDVRVRGEELLANWFGWANRALEASATPESVPHAWRLYAFHGYLLLQELDRQALEPRLPPAWFYNLMLSGRRS